MTKFFISTDTHAMLPVAHRLRLEGHDVETVVHKARFRRAWEGKQDNWGKDGGKIRPDDLTPITGQIAAGELTALVDSPWWTENVFKGPRLFGALKNEPPNIHPLRAGGWFDGTTLHALHFLVYDVGAWPYRTGPAVPGALTLIRDDSPDADAKSAMRQQLESELKARDFKGLVNVGLIEDNEGGLKADGLQAGWPFLHLHAFLSEVEGFGDVLQGAVPVLPMKYVTVVPVTIPPWPNHGTAAEKDALVEGLTPQQQSRVFWHDIRVLPEERKVLTAGLDGLVGVVRGAAQSPVLSQARALEVAAKIILPQKQWRPDVGQTVGAAVASLEMAGLVV